MKGVAVATIKVRNGGTLDQALLMVTRTTKRARRLELREIRGNRNSVTVGEVRIRLSGSSLPKLVL